MKAKLIFGIINVLLYPPVIYCIVYLTFYGNAINAGMALLYLAIIASVITIIVSMIVAQLVVGAWWVGLVSFPVSLIAFYVGYSIYGAISYNAATPYTEYYESGIVQETGFRKRGDYTQVGTITKYYEDGSVESVTEYKYGTRNGKFEMFHPTGQLMASGEYVPKLDATIDGVPNGEWSYYWQDGRVDDKRVYKQGEIVSSKNYTLFYDSQGLICRISDKKPFTGRLDKTPVVSDAFFPNLIDAMVIDGAFDGAYCEYLNTNGLVILFVECIYKKGKLNGEMKTYHQNGKLRFSCRFENDEKEGVARRYNEDGELTSEHNYRNGELVDEITD